MLPISCAAIMCWSAVLINRQRRPLPGNEVQERVYSRLLGRQQRLILLALIVTMASFFATLAGSPQRIDPSLNALRSPVRRCNYPSIGFPICYRAQPDGTWGQEELQEGHWITVGTVSHPPPTFDRYNDPATLNR
jgi:hypothetical protein